MSEASLTDTTPTPDEFRIPDQLIGPLTSRREFLDPFTALREREAIRNLAVIYSYAVDDCDIERLRVLFTDDASFDLSGQVVHDRDHVLALLEESMTGFRTMLHTPNTHLVHLHTPDRAVGWASGHAELTGNRTTVVAAYRYADEYQRVEGSWRFAKRAVRFQYAVPAQDYPTLLSASDRIAYPGTEARPADYPESLPTWRARHLDLS